jgi:hypothetical protein
MISAVDLLGRGADGHVRDDHTVRAKELGHADGAAHGQSRKDEREQRGQ